MHIDHSQGAARDKALTVPTNLNSRIRLMQAFYLLAKTLIVLSFCFVADPSPARAHPHVWIDLRSVVVLDEAGRVTAIEQQWSFDPLYSVFATDGLDTGTSTQVETLRGLAKKNLQELRAYDYFTKVLVGGKKAALGTVREFESEMRDGRLWMRFLVPLEAPVDPTRRKVAFTVFDPTYYIEILHLRDDVIAFRGNETRGCYGQIVQPSPTTEAIMLARAMDRDATPYATLGEVFAERVDITC